MPVFPGSAHAVPGWCDGGHRRGSERRTTGYPAQPRQRPVSPGCQGQNREAIGVWKAPATCGAEMLTEPGLVTDSDDSGAGTCPPRHAPAGHQPHDPAVGLGGGRHYDATAAAPLHEKVQWTCKGDRRMSTSTSGNALGQGALGRIGSDDPSERGLRPEYRRPAAVDRAKAPVLVTYAVLAQRVR